MGAGRAEEGKLASASLRIPLPLAPTGRKHHVLLLFFCLSFPSEPQFYHPSPYFGGLDGKEPDCNAGDRGSIDTPPPEKGMAAHSSILAWRIPWTEEPGGGLQSLGSQTVRHD